MAYTKEIRLQCGAPGCSKFATHEVFNNKNASLGKYCKADAFRVQTRQTKLEQRESRGC